MWTASPCPLCLDGGMVFLVLQASTLVLFVVARLFLDCLPRFLLDSSEPDSPWCVLVVWRTLGVLDGVGLRGLGVESLEGSTCACFGQRQHLGTLCRACARLKQPSTLAVPNLSQAPNLKTPQATGLRERLLAPAVLQSATQVLSCLQCAPGRDKLGHEHPNTLTSVNNLADLLQYQGKLEEAEQLFREALDARRGPSGPPALNSLLPVVARGLFLDAKMKLPRTLAVPISPGRPQVARLLKPRGHSEDASCNLKSSPVCSVPQAEPSWATTILTPWRSSTTSARC